MAFQGDLVGPRELGLEEDIGPIWIGICIQNRALRGLRSHSWLVNLGNFGDGWGQNWDRKKKVNGGGCGGDGG